MFDILFVRTFVIIGLMLSITALASRIIRLFEFAKKLWIPILGTFLSFFAIFIFSDIFPLNLILVAIFSACIGWEIGPFIEELGKSYKLKKYLKTHGIEIKKGQEITDQQKKEFEQSFDVNQYQQEWHNTIFQALAGTALAVFSSVGIVFFTSIDFSFLASFLFISILIYIVMVLLNRIFFHSKLFSLVRGFFGAVIFTFYLLYDFSRLKEMAGDETWGAAIDIAVNLYLDIINLFLILLEILEALD